MSIQQPEHDAWWPEAYPLLYLPSYCSFRMTDIWRSVRCAALRWANGFGGYLFHSATVFRDRNEHNLMRDFEQEMRLDISATSRLPPCWLGLPVAGECNENIR